VPASSALISGPAALIAALQRSVALWLLQRRHMNEQAEVELLMPWHELERPSVAGVGRALIAHRRHRRVWRHYDFEEMTERSAQRFTDHVRAMAYERKTKKVRRQDIPRGRPRSPGARRTRTSVGRRRASPASSSDGDSESAPPKRFDLDRTAAVYVRLEAHEQRRLARRRVAA
jgi:hypothetical protein